MKKIKLSAGAVFGIIAGVLAVGTVLAASTPDFKTLFVERLADRVPINTVLELFGFKAQTPVPAQPELSLGAQSSNSSATVIEDNNGDQVAHVRVAFNTNTTTLNAALTVASIADPFTQVTSTVEQNTGGVVLSSDTGSLSSYHYGFVGATSTVELVKVHIDGTAPTTTFKVVCSASADGFSTSSLAIVSSDAAVPTSTIGTVQSGITSSTAYGATGFGSAVYDTVAGQTSNFITKILLTPQQPYLVCNLVQPYGTSLDTFFGSNNTSNTIREVLARISRTR